MVYQLLKWIAQLSIRVFYRRIEVQGLQHVPRNGPLIVVSNHPNTLMDPLLVAAQLRQPVSFLTKASYFNTPFKMWLLQKLHMIPVYRKQDEKEAGKSAAETMQANQQVFARCIGFLEQGGTLLIFPEGTSILERRLRDIKSGTARMALGSLSGTLHEIPILPVGLNYSDANLFRSNVLIQIGAPISTAAFAAQYRQQPSAAVQQLTRHIRQRMEELIVITEDEEQDNLARQVEQLYQNQLMDELGHEPKDQAKRFELSRGIASSIGYFKQHDPLRVRKLHLRISNYLNGLKRLRLHHRHLQSPKGRRALLFESAGGLLYLLLGLPVFLYGLLHNYLPYRLPGLAADKLTEDQEFEAPIMMVTGMLTFPVWYGLCLYAASRFVHEPLWLLLYALSLPLSGFFALHYRNAFLSQRGRWQLLYLLSGRKELMQRLRAERSAIIDELEKAKEEVMKGA